MLLKKLSEAAGASSRESEVRDIIKAEIEDRVDEMRVDVMGNIIATSGADKEGTSLMLAAHMDEIGLMITDIKDNGLLSFSALGGIDQRILVSKVVEIGEDKVTGVIGSKAVHLQKKSERKRPIDMDNLYIDIGAESKKEAEKKISRGDTAVFKSDFKELNGGYFTGKAFDDRAGCAILSELTSIDPEVKTHFVFTVQEEVGLRGARQAAYDLNPDFAVAVESTTAADVPENEEHRYSTELDGGPALTIQDRKLISDRLLIQELIRRAEKSNIGYQIRRTAEGANDAGVIHLTRSGIPSAVVSVPSRYIHSPHGLMSSDDYEDTKKLIKNLLTDFDKEGKLKKHD